MRTKLLFVFLLLGAFLCFTQPASAGSVSWDLDVEFSGAQTPSGTAPWGNATFVDNGGGVTLTMTSYLNQAGLANDPEYFREWYFNFDPSLNLEASDFEFQTVSTGIAATVTVDENNLRADGDGWFDVVFDWNNNDFDGNGETVVYFIAGVSAADFNYLSSSTKGGTLNDGLPHAAHALGLPWPDAPEGQDPVDGGSGWLTTPIPGSALLLAPGLILLGALRRKFKS
jgi:hypothetical protein